MIEAVHRWKQPLLDMEKIEGDRGLSDWRPCLSQYHRSSKQFLDYKAWAGDDSATQDSVNQFGFVEDEVLSLLDLSSVSLDLPWFTYSSI